MKYLFVICFLFQIFTCTANAQAYKYHTVKKGETVFSISQNYNIEEEDIYKFNPDAKNGIGVNEKLVIPISENSNSEPSLSNTQFREHEVKKKETLYSLSKQYNVEIDQIKRYNKELYSRELQTGEIVKIPLSTSEVAKEKESSPSKPQDKPVQITSTREHIVLPKETKYGIARKYGMTVKELEALNPKIDELQPGMMIRVGTEVLEDEPVIITDERFRFHEVQPKETLFSLSKHFGVSQDSIVRLNPALASGLKSGMVLKVPAREDGEIIDSDVYTGRGDDAEAVVDLSTAVTNLSTKNIALMLPFNLETVEADSLETYKKAILDQRVLRISLDFYSGVLMAVDKAKSFNISTNLKVYDTKGNAAEAANIVNTNNFNDIDAVIGPLLQESTEAVASRLENENIPVINPLSNRSMRGYRNLFQSRPTEEMLRSAMMQYIAANASGKNVVIVADGKNFQLRNELSNMLPSAKLVIPTDNFISEERLKESIVKGRNNWVILESENINLVSSVTSALHRLARENDITLLTTYKGRVYDSDILSNNHLGKLEFHYPSVDREYEPEVSEDFISNYSRRFGIKPNQYAIRGYDLTLDVLLRLGSAEDLYDSFSKYPGYTEYFESKFHYLPNADGGFINDAIYILKLNNDLTISRVNDF